MMLLLGLCNILIELLSRALREAPWRGETTEEAEVEGDEKIEERKRFAMKVYRHQDRDFRMLLAWNKPFPYLSSLSALNTEDETEAFSFANRSSMYVLLVLLLATHPCKV